MKKIFILLIVGLFCITGCQAKPNKEELGKKILEEIFTVPYACFPEKLDTAQSDIANIEIFQNEASECVVSKIEPYYEFKEDVIITNTMIGMYMMDTSIRANIYNYELSIKESKTKLSEDGTNLEFDIVIVRKLNDELTEFPIKGSMQFSDSGKINDFRIFSGKPFEEGLS